MALNIIYSLLSLACLSREKDFPFSISAWIINTNKINLINLGLTNMHVICI